MKYCYKCGSPIRENASFCVKCGARVSPVQAEGQVLTGDPNLLRSIQEDRNQSVQDAENENESNDPGEKKKKTNKALVAILILAILGLVIGLVIVLVNKGGSEDEGGGSLVAEYNGNFKITDDSGKVWVETKHVSKVTVEKEEESAAGEDTYKVRVDLTEDGKKLLEDVTRKNKGKQIYIYIDEVIVSAPVITEAISGGVVEIAGGISKEEANKMRDAIIGDAVNKYTEEVATDPAKQDTEASSGDSVVDGELSISEPTLGMILDVLPSLPKYNVYDLDAGVMTHPGLKKMKDKDGVLIGAIFPALSQKAESILKEIQTGRGQGDHFMYDVQDVITMSEIFANETVSEKYVSQCAIIINQENECALYGVNDGMVDAYDATENGPRIDVERIESSSSEITIYYLYYETPGDSGDHWEAHFTVEGGRPWFDYTKYLGNSGGGSGEPGNKNTEKDPAGKETTGKETTETPVTEETKTEKEKATEKATEKAAEDAVQILQKDREDLGRLLSFIMCDGNHFWSNRTKTSGYSDSDAIDSVMSAMNWACLSTKTTDIEGKTYYMCPVDAVCRIINLLAKNDITEDELPALIKAKDDRSIEQYREWNPEDWFKRTKVENGMVLSPMEVGEPLSSVLTDIAAEGNGAVVTFYVYGAGEGEEYWLAHFSSDGKGGVYLESIEPKD